MKILSKFLVSVTSCGNELFATAYGKRQHERDRQKYWLLAPHVPVWPSAKLNPEQSRDYNPCQAITVYLYKGLSKWKYIRLYQTQKLHRIFQISCPLYCLNAWASEVHMNHPKSFQLRMQIWHKIHLNKLFEFIKTQIILFSLFLILSFVE